MHDTEYVNIPNLQALIGKEKEITNQIISHLNAQKPVTPDILPVLSLLLTENRFSVIEVIQSILLQNPNMVKSYLESLQASKFYNQRCAVPRIILKIPNTQNFLRNALRDDTGLVVKEAVESLKEYDEIPISDDELLEVALYLNNHQYEYIQCLVPEVIINIKQKTFLLTELSLAKSWRKRLSLVRKISHFNVEDIQNMYNVMSRDPEEAVRLALVDQINKLSEDTIKKYAEIFIMDRSENVRSLLIKKAGIYLDESMLNNVVNDSSWIVRKELLCIHREDIYEKISLPIIQSLPNNHTWRIKIEILETILYIVHHNNTLVQKCLLDTLFKYLTDSVYEVRLKAGTVLREVIKADWSYQLLERLECFLQSSYLVRITLIESYMEFDKKHNTKFIKGLLVDRVINVRMKVFSLLEKEDLDSEMIEIIRNETDEEMKADVERLLR